MTYTWQASRPGARPGSRRQSVSLRMSRTAMGGAVVVLLALLPMRLLASCADLVRVPSVVEMSFGTHREIRVPVPITRLAVGNPNVADVQLSSDQAFIISGKQAGATNITIWTRCSSGPVQQMLFVEGEATTSLSTPAPIAPDAVPLLSQVQTDIRFVEVSRSKLREIGISVLGGAGSRNFMFGSPGASPGSVPVGGVGGITEGAPLPLSSDGFNIVWGGGSSKILGALNALENSGFAYTLSQPSLVSLSGQSATFLAGGEFPVPVPSAASDSMSIQYKEFGVRLSLTPTVVDSQRIVLKVAPEVSELDFNAGITIAGTSVPALNVRRTDTTVSLASGESFIISGLINTRNNSYVDKLPGLGDLPILGAFFRSTRIEREERELLMIVTPHLVQPIAAGANMPELPGEELRTYDPSIFQMLFDGQGDFGQLEGLSR